MWSKQFWQETTERAVKSFAGALASCLSLAGASNFINSIPIWELPWASSLGISATVTVYSILISLGSAPFGPPDSPSLVAMAAQPSPAPHHNKHEKAS